MLMLDRGGKCPSQGRSKNTGMAMFSFARRRAHQSRSKFIARQAANAKTIVRFAALATQPSLEVGAQCAAGGAGAQYRSVRMMSSPPARSFVLPLLLLLPLLAAASTAYAALVNEKVIRKVDLSGNSAVEKVKQPWWLMG